MTQTIVPVVLCKNEERFIERVLWPLISVFDRVIVADTGSTDTTLMQLQVVPGVLLKQFPSLNPKEVGQARQWLQDHARDNFGASHVFLVDADELYPSKYLQFIKDHPMPDNALSGFTWGKEIRQMDNGELRFLNYQGEEVGLNRQAIISIDSKWSGEYPFESPSTYKPGDPTNYYWKSPDPTYHFYHLHQTTRSSKDAEVYLRMQKRNQLSMRDTPEVTAGRLWLSSDREYKDE